MTVLDWFRRVFGFGTRTEGLPTSSNGASSFHLFWDVPSVAIQEVSATLTIVDAPKVNRLYFWALQASFTDASGAHHGAGHLGLQWHDGHPGHTAANWGGYGAGGGELSGSTAPLPSARGNPNTRDFAWVAGRPYRLTIRQAADGSGWSGLIDGVELRVLHADGDRIASPMVWSEVFARCDDPSVVVRWSDLEVIAAGGPVTPTSVRTNYQTRAAGGCDNTNIEADGNGFRQITNAVRTTVQDTRLAVPPSS